jgi:hypothetical protein
VQNFLEQGRLHAVRWNDNRQGSEGKRAAAKDWCSHAKCLFVTQELVFGITTRTGQFQRPTRVVREVVVDLPKPRDQLVTREDPAFLHARHEVLQLIRDMRQAKVPA